MAGKHPIAAKSSRSTPRSRKPNPEVTVEGPTPSKSGGQIWRLHADNAVRTVTTSASSTDVLIDTKVRRDKVLRRLAKR